VVAFVATTEHPSAMEFERDLLLWDMVAGTTVNLTTGAEDSDPVDSGRSPSLDGGRVAYSTEDGGVCALDLDSGVRTTVPTDETATSALGPQLQGTMVVWLARGADDLTGVQGSYLVKHDLTTGAEARIGNPPDKVRAGWVFDGDHILYLCGEEGPSGLHLFTISTGDSIVIPGSEGVTVSETGGSPPGYDLAGDYVVWRTLNGADLHLYRISTGYSTVIPRLGEWSRGGPTTDGESVLYSGLVDRDGWTQQNLYAYDIGDASTTVLDTSVMGEVQNLCVDGTAYAYDVYAGMNSPFMYGGFFPVFVDVPADHPYFQAINQLGAQGIIVGYEADEGREFRPEEPVWRAQFAKVIDGSLDLPVTEDMTSPFIDLGPDVPDNLYPHEYVAAAYDNGITTGLTPTTFGPFVDISRAQVVSMVVRAAQLLRPPGFLATPDPDYHSPWGAFSPTHQANADIADYNGLTAGLDLASLDPWGSMTRGEVAQMLVNLRNHQPTP
jgi:hypothetical protein